MATTQGVEHGLKELAENAGKGATALAAALGVSRAAVGHWLRGRSRPQPEHLPPLAEALGVDMDTLRSGLRVSRERWEAARKKRAD